MSDPGRMKDPFSDEDLFRLLAQAQRQYDQYIELARLAGFIELTTRAEAQPPEHDTPLSLTIWPSD